MDGLTNAIIQMLQCADLFLKQKSMLIPEFTYFDIIVGFFYMYCVLWVWRKVLNLE